MTLIKFVELQVSGKLYRNGNLVRPDSYIDIMNFV